MSELSFEYFPPRSEQGQARLRRTHARLARHRPDYVSVTFGAGGTTREGTREALSDLAGARTPTVAHLAYSGVPQREILAYADDLWRAGQRRILALRGDADPCGDEEFSSVADFIRALLERHPFSISVACYPETHPMAPSPKADLDVLLDKERAGATAAISQFFFDTERFVAFVDRARAAGVTMSLVPGILPILDIEKAIGFADDCGSSVPQWVRDEYLTALRTGTDTMAVSRRIVVQQVRELREAGIDALHVYTMNRHELADAAAEEFRRYDLSRAA